MKFILKVLYMMCLNDIEYQIKQGDTSRAARIIQRYFRYKIHKLKKQKHVKRTT